MVERSKTPPKSRGLSPFRKRGKSPTPAATSSSKSRGKSPLRSLSPFRRNPSSQDNGGNNGQPTNRPNVLVCHESAHAIVFRDHLRLARKIIQEVDEETEGDLDNVDSGSESSESSTSDGEEGQAAFENMRSLRQSIRASVRESTDSFNKESSEIVHEINELAQSMVPELKDQMNNFELPNVSERNVEIEGLHAHITPLDELEYTLSSEFEALLSAEQAKEPTPDWTPAEVEVYDRMQRQKACVKTLKNSEWPIFLKRFLAPKPHFGIKHAPTQHDDIGPHPQDGFPFNSFVTSTTLLPENGQKMRCYGSNHAYNVGVVFALPDMDDAAEEKAQKETHTWAWPAGYAAKTEFNVSHGKLINGRQEALVSFQQLRKYNHDYVHKQDHYIAGKMIQGGFNIVPYNEVFLRVGGRGRIVQNKDVVTGEKRVDKEGTGRSFESGVGVFCALFIRSITMSDIISLFRTRARVAHILGEDVLKDIPLLYIHNDHGVRVLTKSIQQQFWKMAANKLQPFKNPILAPSLSYHNTNDAYLQTKLEEAINLPTNLQQALSHKELARIAGGFGATDASFSDLLYDSQRDPRQLQEVMTEGLASSIRAGDHFAAKQLLILYVLQASSSQKVEPTNVLSEPATTYENKSILNKNGKNVKRLPPPIGTKRLRRATSLEGLLVVLGATQILKTIATGSAQRRTEESYEAVEEWVKHGEESVAFRLASWKQQKADEADSRIAMARDSKMMAFVTNKSVHNRKHFAQHLREASPSKEFNCTRFLQAIYGIVSQMHSPCMRLELLQFILGLDNRYSVTLIKESIELVATCLSLTD